MNITSGSALTNPWKGIKVQYVSLACGLALAGAIAVSLEGLPQTGSGSDPAAPATSISAPAKPVARLYIVGSEEEAAVLELAWKERGLDSGSWESLIMARSEQEAASVLQDVDPQAVVHDLRGKLGVSGSGAHPDPAQPADNSALQQAIIVHAASGEVALYGVAP
jgi:hypothetical protein